MHSNTVEVPDCTAGTSPDFGRQWYALRVKPQHERTVGYALQKKGFERYLPLYKAVRRWADNLKELEMPIFPGHVFCRLALTEAPSVLATPAVYQLVARGCEPEPIEAHQLHIIQRIESAGLPIIPWPFLKAGQTVRITQGPLSGVTGLLAGSTKSWHVVVNVQLLQRGVAVTVNRSDLAPLAAAATA